jgi:threonyl-tRNA synthetase
LWLAPDQFIILPISEKYVDYAKKVSQLLENHDISGLIDDRNEKTGKKIRDAELKKIPFMIVVGENEEKDGTISVRRRSEGDLGVMKIEDFVSYFKEQSKTGFEFNA